MVTGSPADGQRAPGLAEAHDGAALLGDVALLAHIHLHSGPLRLRAGEHLHCSHTCNIVSHAAFSIHASAPCNTALRWRAEASPAGMGGAQRASGQPTLRESGEMCTTCGSSCASVAAAAAGAPSSSAAARFAGDGFSRPSRALRLTCQRTPQTCLSTLLQSHPVPSTRLARVA